MTDRNRVVLIWAGWIIAIAGLLIEFVGSQSRGLLGGRSLVIGSIVLLIGILISAFARRKASV